MFAGEVVNFGERRVFFGKFDYVADNIEQWRSEGGTSWVWIASVNYRNRDYWEGAALATRKYGYLPAYDHRGGSPRGLWRDRLSDQERVEAEGKSAGVLTRELIYQAKIHSRLAREAEGQASDCDLRAWEDPQREACHSQNASNRRAEAAAHYGEAKHLARMAGENARRTAVE
ncbi:hypothetical protein ABWI00_06075 [Algihabitans albus]|uniref:hypothetical protein n=1 Tax=Algihabitans albus TaxID=2164067 RepID=UPI0035D0F6A5